MHDSKVTEAFAPEDAGLAGRWAAFKADVVAAIRGVEQDYTILPLRRAILLLAIPMVLETSMFSIFAICDAYFVARLGPAAVASVGMSDALLSIIFAVGLGLSMGTVATVARRFGEKKPEQAAKVTGQAIVLSLIAAVVFGGSGVFFASDLLTAMGADQEILRTGLGYATNLFGGSGIVVLLFLINGAFRGAGDPIIALRALTIANAINLALDPILIFGLGPIPALGVTGAAIATNIGRSIGVLYQLRILFGGHSRLRLAAHHLKVAPEIMLRLLRVSGQAVLQFAIATTSFTGLVKVLAPSSIALAGYTIAVRVIIFVLLPAWGMANASAMLVGQNLGAGKPERAESAVWATARYNLYFLTTVGILFILTARPIISLFTDVEEVIYYGTACLRIVCFGYPLMAYGMVMVSAFNGAGDTATPTWVNLGCHWLLKLSLAWYLAWSLGWGPIGVFVAIPAAEAAVAATAVVLFRRGGWKSRAV